MESGATDLDIYSEPEFKGQTRVPGSDNLPSVCQTNSCPSPNLGVLNYKEKTGSYRHSLVDGGLAPQGEGPEFGSQYPCEQLGMAIVCW